jgi:phage terminase large subunit
VIIGPAHRRHQQQAWEARQRFNILVWHRRAGKTVYAIKWLIKMVLSCELNAPRGAYLAPIYKQAKIIAWQYLKDFTRDIPGVSFNEAELRADFPNGAQIRLLGAAEPDSLRGLYLDAVVMDEMAQMAPRAFTEVVRPALSDRTGSALLIGTVFGRANLFYEYFRDADQKTNWYRQLLTVDDTDAINPNELALLKQDMSPDEWQQEMLCDWDAAVKGSFYGKEMNDAEKAGRIGNVPHDPALPVLTSWDLGMADSTIVTCWQKLMTGEIRAIDCIEFQNTGLPDIVHELKQRPYNYTEHVLPHDAKVRELGTGKSRVEILQSLGIQPTIARMATVQDGINAVRTLLPRVWFDRTKCFRLVEAMKTYRSDYNDQRQVFNKTPLHSWESHFGDSVRYFAIMEGQLGRMWAEPDYSHMDRAAI